MFLIGTGQVVSSEVVMASESGCPIEVHSIEIEKCDEMYDKECEGGKSIPFHRAAYDRKTGMSPNSPREQVSLLHCFTPFGILSSGNLTCPLPFQSYPSPLMSLPFAIDRMASALLPCETQHRSFHTSLWKVVSLPLINEFTVQSSQPYLTVVNSFLQIY